MKILNLFPMRLSIFLLALLFISCQQTTEKQEAKETIVLEGVELILDAEEIEKTLVLQMQEKAQTREEKQALTPDGILTSLKEGNQRFLDNNLTARNHSAQARNSALGQYPKAVILSCLDSRIPVEDVFYKGIDDLFVARVAGYFVNADILGSMEF